MAEHNIFVKATHLHGVCGRVKYVSSPEKQERLEAVYSTTDDQNYWKELADHCQKSAKAAGHKKACEGREFMTMLANELYDRYDPEYLAQRVSAVLKELTGTENVSGVHWNKKENNYHIHTVCSENPEVNIEKRGEILSRNTYYDAAGKRSTKKTCTDQDGNLLPGCEFIKKGGQKIDFIRFGAKNEEMKTDEFLDLVKQKMADLQNELLQEKRFEVFIDDGLHLKQQHIGKNTTPAQKAAIIAKNEAVIEYNEALDQAWKVSLVHPGANRYAQKHFKKWRNEIKASAGKNWVETVKRITGTLKKFRLHLIDELKKLEQGSKAASTAKENKAMVNVAAERAELSEDVSEPHGAESSREKGKKLAHRMFAEGIKRDVETEIDLPEQEEQEFQPVKKTSLDDLISSGAGRRTSHPASHRSKTRHDHEDR